MAISNPKKQQEKFELSITAENVKSTDERFTMDNLSLGDNYIPLDVYFQKANGSKIKRSYSKGERRNSNQTLPRLAFQIFEKQIRALSVEDKENFPTCKYNPNSTMIRGIFASAAEIRKIRNSIEYMTYNYDNGRQFVIYSWNIFSTIIFVQECLLILRNQKHFIGAGSRQIYGILFDGAWLWEEYVNLLIKDVFFHPMNRSGKDAQRLFDENVGLIYPDFIGHNAESRIIADAKYKPIGNIGNRDYLQVLAYMFRFDAKTGYYLYPEAEGSDDLILRMNCGSTYEGNVTPRDDIKVIKHGLKIPVDAPDYDGFVVKMKACERQFRSELAINATCEMVGNFVN